MFRSRVHQPANHISHVHPSQTPLHFPVILSERSLRTKDHVFLVTAERDYAASHPSLATLRPSAYNCVHMACPFFMPTTKLDAAPFLHPTRLPLGGGWSGRCSASGHENADLTTDELKNCNLGYASNCSRLPRDRASDAIRFSVARDLGSQLSLWFVHELNHRPAGHGTLEYDVSLATWTSPHADPNIQKMADCYLQAYLQRRTHPVPTRINS